MEEEGTRLLKLLGIDHRKDHLPGQISGGEMQRVAIARAMVNRPEILLADEPTGNLDTKRSAEIVQVLKDLNRNASLTIVMVTHNQELARHAGRVFEVRDGQIHRVDGQQNEPGAARLLAGSPDGGPGRPGGTQRR